MTTNTSDPDAGNNDPARPGPGDPTLSAPSYTLWEMILYALKLGTFGFGGPVALVGYMHRDLVETRKWIWEADYKAVGFIGYLVAGFSGAVVATFLPC